LNTNWITFLFVFLTLQVIDEQLNYIMDEDTKKHAKSILNKCSGLPKVIVAAGNLLAETLNWEALNDNFIQQLETRYPEVVGWLDAFFHTCPDELKPTIFYLSIFPGRHGIRRRRLVRRWIAEGYSRDTDYNLAEVDGENYFSRLVSLGLLTLCDTDTERGVDLPRTGSVMEMGVRFYVNDFFREYVVSRPMEDNHVFALEGRCSQPTRRTVGRHLVMDKSWDGDQNVFNKIEFSRLRSLTLFGPWKPFFTSDKMRVLRVLDLEDTEGLNDMDVENIVRRLPRLKFLSLRRCKHIFRLPESLGHLRQLETLDVRHTAVAWLPVTLFKLKKLQYVRAGSSPSQCVSSNTAASTTTSGSDCLLCPCQPVDDHNIGVGVSWGIGELTNLHTLGVTKATVAGLKELKKLTQLRKLGVSGINRRNHKALRDAVSGHGHLESLSIWLDNDIQGTDLCLQTGVFLFPDKLRRLKLHGHVDRLPEWIRILAQLPDVEVSIFPLQDAVLVRQLSNFQDGGDDQETSEASSEETS
jgi:Leucine-rich repeat (LRR) protein